MSDKRKDGGPAFPGPSFTQNGHPNGHAMGMTLRDYFAGQALAGLLAGRYSETTAFNLSEVPEESFKIADALLAAREAAQ